MMLKIWSKKWFLIRLSLELKINLYKTYLGLSAIFHYFSAFNNSVYILCINSEYSVYVIDSLLEGTLKALNNYTQ
jgi:hypothetical protein